MSVNMGIREEGGTSQTISKLWDNSINNSVKDFEEDYNRQVEQYMRKKLCPPINF